MAKQTQNDDVNLDESSVYGDNQARVARTTATNVATESTLDRLEQYVTA